MEVSAVVLLALGIVLYLYLSRCMRVLAIRTASEGFNEAFQDFALRGVVVYFSCFASLGIGTGMLLKNMSTLNYLFVVIVFAVTVFWRMSVRFEKAEKNIVSDE